MSLIGLMSRSTTPRHPRDPVLADILGGYASTSSGISVTPDSAMQEAAVYACTRFLSESVAKLPLHVYRRRKSGGKDKATDHPLYEILRYSPNRRQTSYEFRQLLSAMVELRGNSCSLIVPSGGSAVGELIPLEPDRLTIFQAPDGRRAYRYWPEPGGEIIYLQNEIFHVMGMSFDGIAGLSPIAYHRETVGASLAIKEFGARLFRNGTHVGTVIEHPAKVSPAAKQNLKDSLESGFSSVVNAGKAMILEEGMKLSKIGMTSEDAQYLESRKFGRSEIASIFGVPPHKIGDLEKATFSNIEQQSIEFVTDCLMPRLVRFEEAVTRDLISRADRRRGYFAEFNVMGLLRGDADARSKYYTARFATGSITPNQIRAHENENPEGGGDTCFVPLNMIPIEMAGQNLNQDQPVDGGDDK